MGGLSGAALPPVFFFSPPPLPWNWEPPNTLHLTPHPYPTPPSPVVLRQPSTQHSTISLSTPPPSLCIPVWGLWDWYVVFGSVLLIFCWMNFFFVEFIISHFFVVFLFLSPPNKIIAIAAVQPASHDFFSVAACCTNQGCSYIFTFCMTKKTTL